jgi:hypothetical protein
MDFGDVDADYPQTAREEHLINFKIEGVVEKMVVGVEHGHEIAFLCLLLNGHWRMQLKCFSKEPTHSEQQASCLIRCCLHY